MSNVQHDIIVSHTYGKQLLSLAKRKSILLKNHNYPSINDNNYLKLSVLGGPQGGLQRSPPRHEQGELGYPFRSYNPAEPSSVPRTKQVIFPDLSRAKQVILFHPLCMSSVSTSCKIVTVRRTERISLVT